MMTPSHYPESELGSRHANPGFQIVYLLQYIPAVIWCVALTGVKFGKFPMSIPGLSPLIDVQSAAAVVL